MTSNVLWSKEELYGEDFPWTIIDGHVYAIGEFIPQHPGGLLIRRAIGEDATELFHTHHSGKMPLAALARYEIGRLRDAAPAACAARGTREFQSLLNRKIAGLEKVPETPLAECVALSMLALFVAWALLAYAAGWWRLNVALAWFWWRHLDAGLHSASHGDFRYSGWLHGFLLCTYGVLSRRALEYYHGGGALQGTGLSKHLWHHVHTNVPHCDPDWSTMTGVTWVRRHVSAAWQPCHTWQSWYWLPVMTVVEPVLELFLVAIGCLEATAAVLEPPSPTASFRQRVGHACATWVEVLLNPGYQAAAFLCQPWWRALAVLIGARATAKLVLFPFSEVQHYMPEHLEGLAEQRGDAEEWAVTQLRRTANLKFGNPLIRTLDFLMYHGDSFQIEHHLWPAMSFVRFRDAAGIVRAACAEHGVPYHEVGYWEGYAKILRQIRDHAHRPGHEVEGSPPACRMQLPSDGRGECKRPHETCAGGESEDDDELPRVRRRVGVPPLTD